VRVDEEIAFLHLSFRTEHESFQSHSAPACGLVSKIVVWITRNLTLASTISPFPCTALGLLDRSTFCGRLYYRTITV
ncbi:hypothetical protein AB0759_35835, partial [Scytonema tolypothrichoides VB-61278_2]